MDVVDNDRIRDSLRAHHPAWTEDEVDTVAERILATLHGLERFLGVPGESHNVGRRAS
ncbi:MAG TPA: hypothetical protein VEP50_07915 [bacterium]|nr:hypothetical protein [bacterium]